MHFPQTADTRCLRNVPFIIFVKGTAVMPPYVILSISEVFTRFFTTFRMTGYCVLNDRQSHTERQRSICNIARCTLHIIIEKILHYVLHIIIEKILHFVQNDNKGCKASLRSRRMTMKCAKRKSCAFGTTLRSRRMINKGATDPTLTRRRVLNAHSGYQLFRKAVGFFC